MDLKCYLGRKLLLLQPIPQWAIEQIITNIYQTSKKKSAQLIFRLKDLKRYPHKKNMKRGKQLEWVRVPL